MEKKNESEGIFVAIRIRPMNEREMNSGHGRLFKCLTNYNAVAQIKNNEPVEGQTYYYDKVFDESSSTMNVYDHIGKNIINGVMSGINGTIFAYGQTSSGKTFTMLGGGEHKGVIDLAAQDIFQYIHNHPERDFVLRASYVEIYNENIRDLLSDNPNDNTVSIREDPRRGVYCEASEWPITDFDSVMKLIKKGINKRSVEATAMNETSSRSHTIFKLTIESRENGLHSNSEISDGSVLVASLNLVDLAGSESVRHTGAVGQRAKEGGKINQSLLSLSRVIHSLSQSGHVNFRDSKLTRLLQSSLSGNAKMSIVCCITSSDRYLEETRSTLQFASRAKLVVTHAKVNEVVVDDALEVKRLKRELERVKEKVKLLTESEQALKEKLGESEMINIEQQNNQIKNLKSLLEEYQSNNSSQLISIESLKQKLCYATSRLVKEGSAFVNTVQIKKNRQTWGPDEVSKLIGSAENTSSSISSSTSSSSDLELQGENVILKRKFAEMEQINQENSFTIEKLQSNNDELKDKLLEADKAISNLQFKVQSLEVNKDTELSNLKSELLFKSKRISELEAQISSLGQYINNNENILKQDFSMLESEFTEMEVGKTNLMNIVEEHEGAIESLSGHLFSKDRLISEYQQNIHSKNDLISQYQQTIISKDELISSLKEKYSASSSNYEEMIDKLEGQVLDKQELIDSLRLQLNKLQELYQESISRVEEHEGALDQFVSNLASHELISKSYSSQFDQLKSFMSKNQADMENNLYMLESEFNLLEEEKDNLMNVVEEHEGAIESISNDNLSKNNLILLLKSQFNEASSKYEDIIKKLEEKISSTSSHYEDIIDQFEGQLYDKQELIDNLQSELLTFQNLYQESVSRVQEHEGALDQFISLINNKDNQLNNMKMDIDNSSNNMLQEINQLENTVISQEDCISIFQMKLKKLKNMYLNSLQRIEEHQGSIDYFTKALSIKSKSLITSNELINSLTEHIATNNEKNEDIIDELKGKIIDQYETINIVKFDLNRLHDLYSHSRNKIEEYEGTIDYFISEVTLKDNKIKDLQSRIGFYSSQIFELETQILSLNQYINTKENTLTKDYTLLESEFNEMEVEKDNLMNIVEEHEGAIESLSSDIILKNTLISSLKEKYSASSSNYEEMIDKLEGQVLDKQELIDSLRLQLNKLQELYQESISRVEEHEGALDQFVSTLQSRDSSNKEKSLIISNLEKSYSNLESLYNSTLNKIETLTSNLNEKDKMFETYSIDTSKLKLEFTIAKEEFSNQLLKSINDHVRLKASLYSSQISRDKLEMKVNLQNLEIDELNNKIEKLEEKIKLLNDNINTEKEENLLINNQLKENKTKLDEVYLLLNQSKEELNLLNKYNTDLTSNINTLSQTNSDLEQFKLDLERSLQACNNEIQTLKNQISDYDISESTMKMRIEELKKSENNLIDDKNLLLEDIKQLTSKLKKAKEEEESLHEEIQESNSSINSLAEEKANIESMLDKAVAHINELTTALEEAEESITVLNSQLSKFSEMREALSSAELELVNSTADLNERKSMINDLNSKISTYTSEIISLKESIVEKDNIILNLNNSLSESQNVNSRSLELINEKDLTISNIRSELDSKDQTLTSLEMEVSNMKLKLQEHDKNAALEHEMLMNAADLQMDELRNEISQLKEASSSQKDELNSINLKLLEKESQIDILNFKLSEKDSEIETYNNKLNEAFNEIKSLKTKQKEQISNDDETLVMLEEKNLKLKKACEVLKNDLLISENKLNSNIIALNELNKTVEKLREEIVAKDARIQHLDTCKLTKDQMEKIKTMKEERKKYQEDAKTLKKQLIQLKSAYDDLKKSISEGNSEKLKEISTDSSQEFIVSDLKLQLSDANEKLSQTAKITELLKNKLKECSSQLQEYEKERQSVISILEKFGIDTSIINGNASFDGENSINNEVQDLSDGVVKLVEIFKNKINSNDSNQSEDSSNKISLLEKKIESLKQAARTMREENASMTVTITQYKQKIDELQEQLKNKSNSGPNLEELTSEMQVLEEENIELLAENKNLRVENSQLKSQLANTNSNYINENNNQNIGFATVLNNNSKTSAPSTPSRKFGTEIDSNALINNSVNTNSLIKKRSASSYTNDTEDTRSDSIPQSVSKAKRIRTKTSNSGECTQS